jgi:hypothetical protein
MCPSLCRFPWNLQMFNSIMFRFLYQISPKWDNKCGRYRWKFIYTPKQFMAATAPIFTKLTITQTFLGFSAHAFIQIGWKCRKSGKISFTPLSKTSLSLC